MNILLIVLQSKENIRTIGFTDNTAIGYASFTATFFYTPFSFGNNMKMPYLVKTPALLKLFYPGLTWNKSRDEKAIHLTFDDGPIPQVTPFVLQTLAQFGAKATFFCIGDNVQKHSEIFEAVKAGGHAIGNHTFNHLRGWNTIDELYLKNVEQCNLLTQSKLFRPPYGRAKKSQLTVLKKDYEVVMWDVLSGDFDFDLSPQQCYQNVVAKSSNGSIVVFHDSLKAWPRLEYVLPKALEYWQDKGYGFKSL